MASRLPAVFLAHGSPMLAVEHDDVTAMYARLGAEHRPRAIVIVSAHWEAPGPVRVTGAERPPVIYDFSGFPPELYDVRYPCVGDPKLAEEIVLRLGTAALDPGRGIDHGAWVPLLHAYPKADVPVLQVSLAVPRTTEQLVAMGRSLAPLRDRGVMLIGSGGIVHNLRRVHFDDKQAPVDAWAKPFDAWVADRVASNDVKGLSDYASAPEARMSVPTTEHFDPVFVVLGASLPGDRTETLHEGYHYGHLSMRCFQRL